MTVINHKSISGITSITAPAGSDDLLTVHTNDTSERFRILKSGAIVTGVATASNFKTGTTNVHNVGVELAGINVLGADTPIGTGATIYNSGAAVFTGIVTATGIDVNGTGRFTENLTINTTKKILTNSSTGQLTIQAGPSYPGGSIKFAGGQSGATDRGTLLFYAGETTSLQERLRITSAGKVGINSTSPTYALEVDGGTQNTVIVARSSDTRAQITFLDNATTGVGHVAVGCEGNDLFIRTGSGSKALTIKSDGKIGVGIDAPVGTFEIRDSKANLIVAKDGLTAISNTDAHTTYDLIQLGAGGGLASYSTATATADTHLVHNAYRHSGGSWKYKYADTAMRLRMNSPGGAFTVSYTHLTLPTKA